MKKKILLVEKNLVFDTYTEAAKAVSGHRSGVRRCVIGIQKVHKGYHFKYLDD